MIGDEARGALKTSKGGAQRGVAFVGRSVESIVRRQFARDLPDALSGIEFRGVAGEAMEFDFVGVCREPLFPSIVEPMTGSVVYDEKEFPWCVLGGELQQKLVKRVAVEHGCEAIREVGVFERNSTKDVSRLSQSKSVDSGLLAHPRPRLVEGAVEPETRLVFKENKASARVGFFFRAGRRSLSQSACFSASARARRLRGRCTENPISFSKRGTE